MSLELTDEERAYLAEYIEQFFDTLGVGPIILKLQAGKMKAEARYSHRNCVETKDGTVLCSIGGQLNYHTRTDERWMEAAKAKLGAK